MTNDPCWHPDLLRRFLPTPYVFSECRGPNRLLVESNDLDIALGVRQAGLVQLQDNRTGGLLCRLIRDMAGPVDRSYIAIVCDGAIRALYLGTGTILIHDLERSELFGFVARNVQVEELVSSLIPALLEA
ncbi:MAG: hypothetical protein JWQ49_3246 [Edaphobacter sp.]|nr:hypothetical protein [Edaphobacter sp.]